MLLEPLVEIPFVFIWLLDPPVLVLDLIFLNK